MPTLTVTIDDRIISEITARTEGDGRRTNTMGRSQIVERDLDRYYTLLRYARADLRKLLGGDEVALIMDNLNGVWVADHPEIGIRGIPLNVADGIEMEGIDTKWGVDGAALNEKLRELSFIHLAALADAAERFWLDAGEANKTNPRDALAEK